ncbi:hypothetical protein NSU08_39145 [Paenibacillus sp. FSL H7-0331]|uniref:hypothetical protein n=1 Tax=Paenibacillus sp. FSL H7-0331 TaxID=1920421 RepID=UPI0030F4CCA9
MELVEKNYLKINYPKGFYLVKQIIDELDPVDLLDMGAPEDEHDFLTADVLKILIDDRLVEVKQLLINAYSDYGFGVEKVVDENKESFYKKIEDTTIKINSIYNAVKEEVIPS